MNFIQTNPRSDKENNDFITLVNKTAYTQLVFLSLISIIFFLFKEYIIASSFITIGITCFIYTQLIKIAYFSKLFALFGFPLRLLVVGLPCAILVHKFKCNLLALFVGFVICQVIYFINIWQYIKKDLKEG